MYSNEIMIDEYLRDLDRLALMQPALTARASVRIVDVGDGEPSVYEWTDADDEAEYRRFLDWLDAQAPIDQPEPPTMARAERRCAEFMMVQEMRQ